MAEARSRQFWDHTSELIAAIYNAHRVKGEPISAAQCNPYKAGAAGRPEPLTPEESLDILSRAYGIPRDQRPHE